MYFGKLYKGSRYFEVGEVLDLIECEAGRVLVLFSEDNFWRAGWGSLVISGQDEQCWE